MSNGFRQLEDIEMNKLTNLTKRFYHPCAFHKISYLKSELDITLIQGMFRNYQMLLTGYSNCVLVT